MVRGAAADAGVVANVGWRLAAIGSCGGQWRRISSGALAHTIDSALREARGAATATAGVDGHYSLRFAAPAAAAVASRFEYDPRLCALFTNSIGQEPVARLRFATACDTIVRTRGFYRFFVVEFDPDLAAKAPRRHAARWPWSANSVARTG